MNYSRCFLCSALLISAPVWGASGKTTREIIEYRGQKRTFYLFVPKHLPAGGVPLLLTLHGSGRDGTTLVEKWKDLAAEEQIILAGPDSRDSAFWVAPTDGPDFLYAIVERLKQAYPIDPRRVYLFGHSAGAAFALLMSLRESQYFAAAAVHAGALRDYEAADGIARARRKVPMAIFSGTADPYFPIAAVRITRDTLRAAGFPVSLIEMPGHDHNYYAVSEKLNRQAWDFLKQYVLPSAPSYEPYDLGTQRSPAVAREFLGTWEGTLVAGGQPLRFVVKLANDERGASAVLVSPDQGGAEIPVTTIEQKDAKLTLLVMAGVGGQFRGEINIAGTELIGRWLQSGLDLPLKLKKKRDQPPKPSS
ncbi:MAG: PHB depolymerase family esterase [Bryobacteraceae bacterium]|jgi:predicted esterase